MAKTKQCMRAGPPRGLGPAAFYTQGANTFEQPGSSAPRAAKPTTKAKVTPKPKAAKAPATSATPAAQPSCPAPTMFQLSYRKRDIAADSDTNSSNKRRKKAGLAAKAAPPKQPTHKSGSSSASTQRAPTLQAAPIIDSTRAEREGDCITVLQSDDEVDMADDKLN